MPRRGSKRSRVALARSRAALALMPHPVRWVLVTLTGTGLVLAGVAMLALPGPGLLTIFAGVTVLATEFPWAARLAHRIRRGVTAVVARVRSWVRGTVRR